MSEGARQWRVEENLNSGVDPRTGEARTGEPDWLYVGTYEAKSAESAMAEARRIELARHHGLHKELRALPVIQGESK